MQIPDFTEPLLLEINFARQLVAASHAGLPTQPTGNVRLDLASALAHIAVEHVTSILVLFEVRALASGYALMRSAAETTYKAIWIANVADDKQVTRAYQGCDVYGDFKNVIKDIEEEFSDQGTWAETFTRIRPHLRTLHERNHSGAAQTIRRLNAEDFRYPEFDFGELIRDIRTLGAFAMIAVIPCISPDAAEKLNTLMLANYSWLGTVTEAKTTNK